jgi:hypothetical protein
MTARLIAFLLLGRVAGASAQQPSVTLVDTAVLAAPRLGESSGVAASARVGVYWSLNDSGDGAILYTTDSAGRDLGRMAVRGATNVDWEDLSAGPCPRSRARCLYVGDIGDNAARRSTITIYAIPEPAPPLRASDTLRTTSIEAALELRYPDRPHDAEALAVLPDGRFLVITKDLQGPPRIYGGSVRRVGARDTLHFLGTLPIRTSPLTGRLVTGAAVSADGRLLVVRTYVSLHCFALSEAGAPVPLGPPDGIPVPVVETQGEAVAFATPDLLVLTSERGMRGHAILTRLRVSGWHPARP